MRSVTPPTEDALGDTIYEVSPGATAQRVSLGDTDRRLGVLVNEVNQGSSELVSDGAERPKICRSATATGRGLSN
jgi:hypothetical protein